MSLLGKVERKFKHLKTWEWVALAGAGVLLVDYVVAPKGNAMASKLLRKVMPGKPVIPPPGAVKTSGVGSLAGAGWRRAQMPYGLGGWPTHRATMDQSWHAYPWAE